MFWLPPSTKSAYHTAELAGRVSRFGISGNPALSVWFIVLKPPRSLTLFRGLALLWVLCFTQADADGCVTLAALQCSSDECNLIVLAFFCHSEFANPKCWTFGPWIWQALRIFTFLRVLFLSGVRHYENYFPVLLVN